MVFLKLLMTDNRTLEDFKIFLSIHLRKDLELVAWNSWLLAQQLPHFHVWLLDDVTANISIQQCVPDDCRE